MTVSTKPSPNATADAARTEGKPPHEVFLNAAELAARWPVPLTQKGVYRLVNEGRLEDIVTRISRYRVFRLDRVLQWEAAGGRGLGEDADAK